MKKYKAFTKPIYPRLEIELRPTDMLPGEIGLFAVVAFRNKAVIVPCDALHEGDVLTWEKWRSLDLSTRRKLYAFCPGDDKGIYPPPPNLNQLSVPWFCNHSCEPNAAFGEEGNLVAIKHILAGTEVTWDYSTLERNPRFRMLCKCGTRSCRKIIRGGSH